MDDKLRYPIGKFEPQPFSEDLKNELLKEAEQIPSRLAQALQGLNEAQQQTPYRDGGWTVRQVAHHLADADLNTYIRIKKALTETNSSLSVYDQDSWAKLIDVNAVPVQVSEDIVKALYSRLIVVLRNLKTEDWNKTIYHPEMKTELSVWYFLGMYLLWHNKHHIAHITSLRERMRW